MITSTAELLRRLLKAPRVKIGNQICHEIINCTLEFGGRITVPRDTTNSTSYNLGYLVAQMAWYARAVPNSLDGIDHYHESWKRIKGKEGILDINSNYGLYVFGEKQLSKAVQRLGRDSSSRQAVILFNRPDVSLSNTQDHICTTSIQFFIRNWQLHAITTMRSNDFHFGYMFDVPFFRILQLSALCELKITYPELEMGRYYHNVGSMHLYHRDKGLYSSAKFEDEPLGPSPIATEDVMCLSSDLGHVEELMRKAESKLERERIKQDFVRPKAPVWNHFISVLADTLNELDSKR